MAEAWRRVRRVVEDSDLVLEVLDARDPLATRSEELEALAKRLGKRVIAAINKADLVPMEAGLAWKRWLEKQGIPAVFFSAKMRKGTRKLMVYIKRYAPAIPVKVAVVGYPNVGKSTVINYLKGRHVASTSPKPGWTRGEQIVRAKTWLITIDTPGVLPADKSDDLALAVIRGAVDPATVDDAVPYAVALINRVLKFNEKALEIYRYSGNSAEEALEYVGRRYGRLLRGGRVNIDEAARRVLRDWIEGRLSYFYWPPDLQRDNSSFKSRS
ncbi:MAG: GTPase [Thermoproteus sp. AZ2]|uniref:GTPase n=1 Tax=Thermoproteus sp. AZ2 TaxID=1609232 RepID=A0ACC6V0Z6_9CREN|nr:MAG: GTP-binding protein [Thermoproteus sp. AZ2]